MEQLWNDFSNWYNSEALITDSRMGFLWLLAAALITGIFSQLPTGRLILYPFTILATWFHEMGHGLMSILMGGEFRHLKIDRYGNGAALVRGPYFLGRIGFVIVVAAGPLAPSVVGSGLILASRNLQQSQIFLTILGCFMIFSTFIWLRSLVGCIIIPLLGVLILGIGLEASPPLQGFSVQFLGVQACLTAFRHLDYFFMGNTSMGKSDSAWIEDKLFLPHWFWGIVMAAASFYMLVKSLIVAYYPN